MQAKQNIYVCLITRIQNENVESFDIWERCSTHKNCIHEEINPLVRNNECAELHEVRIIFP
jgi:hypothetical protein